MCELIWTRIPLRNQSQLPGRNGVSADAKSLGFGAGEHEGFHRQVCKTRPWREVLVVPHVRVGLAKRTSAALGCKAFLVWLNIQE